MSLGSHFLRGLAAWKNSSCHLVSSAPRSEVGLFKVSAQVGFQWRFCGRDQMLPGTGQTACERT